MHATFLTDCLTLAKYAPLANILDPSIPWNIRKDLANFFKHSAALNPKVFHISREVNGVAHNLAHQVFRANRDTQICCFAGNHSSNSCNVLSLLSNFQIPGLRFTQCTVISSLLLGCLFLLCSIYSASFVLVVFQSQGWTSSGARRLVGESAG